MSLYCCIYEEEFISTAGDSGLNVSGYMSAIETV